jgi:hypothetical protein
MAHTVLIFLLYLSGVLFFLLFVINITRKLYLSRRENLSRKRNDSIKSAIDGFISGTEQDYRDGLAVFARKALQSDKNYLAAVDEYLLNLLECPDTENRERLIDIAGHLYFPVECITQIKSRNPQISACGSRRAGLYKVRKAAPDLEAALDIMSSENQFEIIMAFARMGDAGAVRRAFEKIKDNIMIKEPAVIEILHALPDGEEKKELFLYMINNRTEYVAALFLKAADSGITKALKDEIIMLLKNENKDVRAAAVRSLAVLGKDAPAKVLVQSLEDKDWEVRALAAKALGLVKTLESSGALYKALYDRQWWVRQNAANALVEHPDYEQLFVLAAESGDEYARDSIISALENGNSPFLLRAIKLMVA